MARALITDQNYEDLALERELFGNAGIELAVAQCTTEEDVLAAGRNCEKKLTPSCLSRPASFAENPAG